MLSLMRLPRRSASLLPLRSVRGPCSTKSSCRADLRTGNLAVGSPQQCLPQLVGYIQGGKAQDRKRNLALTAVKEFIVHSSSAVLAPSADALWEPLLSICAVEGPPAAEAKPANLTPDEVKARDRRVDAAWKASEPVREQWKATEVSRTMAAECLGKITVTDPQRYLAKLQVRRRLSILCRSGMLRGHRVAWATSWPAFGLLLFHVRFRYQL